MSSRALAPPGRGTGLSTAELRQMQPTINADIFNRPLAKKICVILKSLLKFRSNFELLG